MKLVATLIVRTQKDIAAELTDLFDSLHSAGVNGYVVGVDDQSVEGTLEWIRERTESDAVFPFTFEDDFSKARNMTLERLPEDTDWFLWVDSDDTLAGAAGDGPPPSIPAYLEKLMPDINAIFCDYQYHFDEFGNCDTLQQRHRILNARAGKWFWSNKVHEDIHREGGAQLTGDIWDGLVWVHHPDQVNRDPQRNFRILKKAIEEEPENPRNYYYLGNQHFANHDWEDAVTNFSKYIPMSGRIDERWSACIYRAKALGELERWDEAIASYMEAIASHPQWADAYFGVGFIHSRLGKWEQAIQWGEMGLLHCKDGRGFTDKSNFQNQNEYMFIPYTWLAVAYFNMGDNEKSLACYEQAVSWRAEPELVYTVKHMKAAMARLRAIDAGLALAAQHMRANEPLKARAVLANLPAGAAEQKALVQSARGAVERRLRHLSDDTQYRNFYFSEQMESVPTIESLAHVKENYPRMDWVLRRLKAAGAKTVLDLGVGNAVSSFYYAQHGIKVLGVDVDWRRVKAANYNAVKLGYLKAFRPKRGTNGREPRVVVMDPDAQVQFHCAPADVLSPQIRAFGPFDAVVAAEIIEHVEHPEKILDAAQSVSKRVIITTPDAAYDGPQEVNVGHVRGWSQSELVPLLAERGRIVELHKIAHPNVVEQANLAAEYVTDTVPWKASVVIWCFNTGQDWSPESITKGGIGGSETAVIRVAEDFAARNFMVTVYAEAEGVWNGVRYKHTNSFVPQPCNIFVSWRSLGPSVEMKDLAQHRLIWSHDMEFGEATAEQLEGVKVVALSQWHKDYMRGKYETADIVVSGNGVDPERFAHDVERLPHRLIYAQSPDRGLDVLLRVFPKVRQRYPDATLEVFYGFDLLDRTGKRDFRKEVESLAKQDGVTLHGRVDQDQLAVEYLKSTALMYPGLTPSGKPFYETYGISIVEAQAAGCVPITPNWGALPEVNQYGIVLEGWNDDVALASLSRVFDEADSDIFGDDNGEKMMAWARAQTWSKVVDGWLEALQPKVAVAVG